MKSRRPIKTKSKAVPLQQCFVIMSFSKNPDIEHPYQRGTKKVVSALGFRCVRVDELPHLSTITDKIEECIRESYFVVADLTEERPNCFYELGYAHGLRKPVILIARKGTQLHFDVSHYPFIFYESEKDIVPKLDQWICGTVLTTVIRDANDDPQNGNFGRLAVQNGRLLTARVLRRYLDEEEDELCDIQVDVHPLPKKPKLEGQVRFYVHPSYTKTFYIGHVKNGYASIKLEGVAGAFTIGAEVDRGETQLELDIAMIPGVPFYRAP